MAQEIVLITGSSGFIGSALAARLSRWFTVVGLDVQQPREPVPGVDTVEFDLTDDASVRNALAEVQKRHRRATIASVIHLAAYYDLSGEPDPKYQTITVEGTRRLLRALQGRKAPRQFVFASTMLVHAPCEPGQRIDEDSPVTPTWPYPQSKVEAEAVIREERGAVPAVVLRPAGIYDDRCRATFLAQQIARIYERSPLSYLFAGDPTHGQPYLHLDDLVEAVVRIVERRGELPPEVTLLLGEPETPSYLDLQHALGRLIHGEPWPTRAMPKALAKAGAWVQDDVLDQDPFIKPWMVDMADDHYALDIGRARELLGWAPRHRLLDTLPAMVRHLKEDPAGWYRTNKLNDAKVAAAAPALERAKERDAELEAEAGTIERTVAEALERQHRRTLWAPLVNLVLGGWLLVSPFSYGLFDPVLGAAEPPALGHALPPPEVRNAWLGLSEMASGLAVMLFAGLALRRPDSWAGWAAAAVGVWVLFAPLLFWTTSSVAYNMDTLIGMLVIVFAVMVRPPPGIAPEARASSADLPLGWSYSPSSYVQRVPIVALAFVGLFVSRYLAAYQLGHIDGVWDPFFAGTDPEGALNGSESVVTSSVSKAFPIPDAGLGAAIYALDILTGAVGDRRRWRTMPWLVLLFGLLIVPLGAVSIVFIMIQPTVIGTLCTLCLLQAAVTVILIPYSIDEVLATLQFLWRSWRADRPFWRTFFQGGAPLAEGQDPVRDLELPASAFLREFVQGGVNYPWQLVSCVAIGVLLMATPLLLGTRAPLAHSDHVMGCLAIAIAVTAMAEVVRPIRFLNVLVGLWVAASPFLLAGGGDVATVADVVLGLGLAALSLPRGSISGEHYGGWDRLIL
ncbi:MAG TPA: NAD-dependent epimerase/dehydratase family protein [Geminicoccaceae bacterium]|nr:NAD-dependent epimerase/dehydratase family protein [Geminicoccaceae bacterium]